MHALTAAVVPWDGCRPVSRGQTAFPEAVGAHDRALFAMARRLCGNDADAADLVHDTFEKALRSRAAYSDSGSLKSWLLTILHNLFIDRCRKARRAPRTDAIDDLEVAAPEPTPPPAWASVTPEQVARALEQIGREFRIVYELHASGRSYDDIAAQLGIPKATVGTRLVRARKKLKDVLVRDLGDPS